VVVDVLLQLHIPIYFSVIELILIPSIPLHKLLLVSNTISTAIGKEFVPFKKVVPAGKSASKKR
jgi:hypothetical protein